MPRFNAPPGWPEPAATWRPPAGWEPSSDLPDAPRGWAFWVDENGHPVDGPTGAFGARVFNNHPNRRESTADITEPIPQPRHAVKDATITGGSLAGEYETRSSRRQAALALTPPGSAAEATETFEPFDAYEIDDAHSPQERASLATLLGSEGPRKPLLGCGIIATLVVTLLGALFMALAGGWLGITDGLSTSDEPTPAPPTLTTSPFTASPTPDMSDATFSAPATTPPPPTGPGEVRPRSAASALTHSSVTPTAASTSTARPPAPTTFAPVPPPPATASPHRTRPPSPTASSTSVPSPTTWVFYKSCAEAWAAGAGPFYKGDPNYRKRLDPDRDGIACERNGSAVMDENH